MNHSWSMLDKIYGNRPISKCLLLVAHKMECAVNTAFDLRSGQSLSADNASASSEEKHFLLRSGRCFSRRSLRDFPSLIMWCDSNPLYAACSAHAFPLEPRVIRKASKRNIAWWKNSFLLFLHILTFQKRVLTFLRQKKEQVSFDLRYLFVSSLLKKMNIRKPE